MSLWRAVFLQLRESRLKKPLRFRFYSYVKQEFTKIIEPEYDYVEMAWKGYVVCDRAMVDPTAAWQDALALRSYELDQAISQSQVLYFVATMEDFVPPTNADSDKNGDGSDQDSSSSGQDTSNNSQSMCSENAACVALGLTGGYCCPTTAGIQLDCCSSSDTTTKEDSAVSSSPQPVSQQQEPPSTGHESCSSNTACAALNLVGSCCPTESGVRLGCCDDSTS